MFKRYKFHEGLTTLFGSEGKVLINNRGQIKDIDGNDLPTGLDSDGNLTVVCHGWNGEREYRIIDLVAIQYKELRIPREDYDKVIAFTIDGDPANTHARNIGYRFKGGRLEYKKRKGFYYVPGLTGLAINEYCIAVSTTSNEELKPYIVPPRKKSRGGYVTFSIRFSRNIQINSSAHRALCLVFKDYPDNVDSLVVNHIDGNGSNNSLDNLEWATYSQNNLHAYINDLKTQHCRVLVRNVFTGEVVEYYSMSECARALGGSTDETIRQRIVTSPFGTVFSDGTQIKLKSDTRDWIIPDDPKAAVRKAMTKAGVPIIAKNCLTGEITRYQTVAEAGSVLGILPGTINYRLLEKNKSPLCGYQFKELFDEIPFPEFTQSEYEQSLVPNSFTVDARNLLTGEVRTYDSVRKAAEDLNSVHIKNCLNQRRQWLTAQGWQVKLSDMDWEEIDNYEEVVYKLNKDIMARNEETGYIVLANSARDMGIELGLDPKAIREAAMTLGNKVYHGYRFRLGMSKEPWPSTKLA